MSAAYILSILPTIGTVILIAGIAFGLCFLFCPMKYDVRASNMDCIKASIRLDFIFKMISVEVFLKKKEKLLTKIKLCLFGKCVWQNKSGKKKKKKKPAEISAVQEEIPVKNTEPAELLEEETKKPNVRRIKMSHPKEPPKEAEKTEIKPKEEDSLIKRVMKMPDKGKFIKLTLNFIKNLFKEIKPDYVYIRAILGTGDPCSTGRYMGIEYAVSGYFGLDTQITPDFENVVYKGKVRLTGSVRLYIVIYYTLGYITKKPVRNLMKIVRNKK